MEMPSFDEAWGYVANHHDGEAVSEDLRPLLEAVYREVLAKPLHTARLKQGMESLLTFLAGEGRTNANCWAVDLFFCLDRGWEGDWAAQGLPADYHDILSMMGEGLHDAVKDPAIAENFGCLPEQLLERVRRLDVIP